MIKAVGLFLLMILKILGWLLLAILVILIAVLLFVLFVPVRYRVLVQNERSVEPGSNPVKNVRVQVKVSWLLHFIHLIVVYGPKGFGNEIHVAGLDVKKVFAWFSKRKEVKETKGTKAAAQNKKGKPKNRKEKHKKEKHKNAGNTEESESQAIPDLMEQMPAKEQTPIDTAGMPEPVKEQQEVDASELTDEQKTVDQHSSIEVIDPAVSIEDENTEAEHDTEFINNKTTKEKRIKRKKTFSNLFSGIQKKLSAIKDAVLGIRTKIGTIRDKFHMFYEEVTAPSHRQVAGHLWKELCYLLKKYKPRKIKANLTFSLADPAITGGVLGMVSLLPHVYRYPYHILADFESDQLYMEGELMLQGKVTGYVVVIILLRLFRDKECMAIVRRLMGRA